MAAVFSLSNVMAAPAFDVTQVVQVAAQAAQAAAQAATALQRFTDQRGKFSEAGNWFVSQILMALTM